MFSFVCLLVHHTYYQLYHQKTTIREINGYTYHICREFFSRVSSYVMTHNVQHSNHILLIQTVQLAFLLVFS